MASSNKIEGLISKPSFGQTFSLVTYIDAVDILEFFRVFEVPCELDPVFQSIHNRKNTQRINLIKNQIKQGLEADYASTLTMSFALTGDVKISSRTSGIATVEYQPAKTVIIDGVLTLFSIMSLMGFSHPFTKKRASKKLIEANSEVRQRLAHQPVQVTLIFNPKNGVTTEQAIDLYRLNSQRDDRLHSPLLEVTNTSSPLNQYIDSLCSSLNLEMYGGIAPPSSKVQKGEPYITSESTLVRFVLGVLGGASIQDKNRFEEFGKEGTYLSKEHASKAFPLIVVFMTRWLNEIRPQINPNSDGFLYSPQLWQALGLVIHDMIFNFRCHEFEFEQAGRILGKLDYSKKAHHWSNCAVMELDAKGTTYKNSTGGGRLFRQGLAKYFISLIGKHV